MSQPHPRRDDRERAVGGNQRELARPFRTGAATQDGEDHDGDQGEPEDAALPPGLLVKLHEDLASGFGPASACPDRWHQQARPGSAW
jgi:hypothetical protein